jgi:transposase-like protein
VSGSWEYVGEKAELEALLDRHQGNIAEVARELDRQWAVVWRWVVKSEYRSSAAGGSSVVEKT